MDHHLLGPSEEGSVVLDIGGDVGAAIVHAPASLAGSEIEIRRVRRTVGRHPCRRPGPAHPGGEVHAALFPGLARGSYEVRVRGDADGPVSPSRWRGAGSWRPDWRCRVTRLRRRR